MNNSEVRELMLSRINKRSPVESVTINWHSELITAVLGLNEEMKQQDYRLTPLWLHSVGLKPKVGLNRGAKKRTRSHLALTSFPEWSKHKWTSLSTGVNATETHWGPITWTTIGGSLVCIRPHICIMVFKNVSWATFNWCNCFTFGSL